MSTHLGNGSHQFLHRHANYIQIQLAMDDLFASFIADGHHIPFLCTEEFYQCQRNGTEYPCHRCHVGCGNGSGTYKLGNERVVVRDDLNVSIPEQQNMAGSALTLDRAILNVAAYCNIPFEKAWHMASVQPAFLIGLKELPEITVEIKDYSFTLK